MRAARSGAPEPPVALARAAVVAGVAAGLGTGWAIQQSQWWRSTAPKPIARTPPPPVAPPSVATVSPPVTTLPEAAAPPALAAGKPQSVAPPAEPAPAPFPAVLGTIFYSPDRKFAIVNDRIVGPGDEVNGARVVDITPTTVVLRDEKGRLRSLTLGADASRQRPSGR